MADGMIGWGAGIRIGRGTAPDWSEMEFVDDFDMPDSQADDIEVSHMKSPGRRKQYIQGMIDSGEVSIPFNLIPGGPTDTMLKELLASGETFLIEFTLPASEGVTLEPEAYSAYLRGYARSIPKNDKMTGNATFRLSESVAVNP